MTDERMGDALWTAVSGMPRGSGIIFRHYGAPDRASLLARLARIARRRGLRLLAAGGLQGPDGVHNARGRGLVTWSAHSRREAHAAIRAGAALLFVSPVWPTRSHPGARTLGTARFAAIVRGLPVPAIALGGMTARRWRALEQAGAYGWAGIDEWMKAGSAARR